MIRYIYTFFVGLFLAIFVAMGISVFHPQPTAPEPPIVTSTGKELSEAEQRAQAAFEVRSRAYEKQLKQYNRGVSLILLTAAIIILTVSLVFAGQLGVIADGILLGGIFTLLYGLGRGMDTDSDTFRFIVATIGLAIALVLGYIKFIRHGDGLRQITTQGRPT